jgi:uncharacterized membrane protein YhaH (DUF805 family)
VGLLAVGYWLLARKSYGLNRQVAKKRQEITGLLLMGLAFGLMALPRFAPALVGQLPLEGNREAMRLPADFTPENTVRAVLAWVGQPDVSPFWLSDAPLLLWPALVLFVIGLIYSVRRWRDARHMVLVAWVVLTTIFGGAIWTSAPLYVRYMTAVPAIGLLVAVSYQFSARALSIGLLLFTCVYGAIAAWEQPQEAREHITPSQWMEDDLARQAVSLPEGASVVLVVPCEFDDLQMITVAHYLAAYGQRRALAVNRDQADILEQQREALPQPVMELSSNR